VLRREDGLVDWALDAFQIERRVRGFQPWPNAYTSYQSRRLVIRRAEAESASHQFKTGEIIEARGDSLVVACGSESLLRLLEVQPEGKRLMRARDFVNGAHVRVGERVG
jgi:methionyl-tRNA formyltransferase